MTLMRMLKIIKYGFIKVENLQVHENLIKACVRYFLKTHYTSDLRANDCKDQPIRHTDHLRLGSF